ncbi:CAP domain-containing protein [Algicella marina]|uniref:CAP domain-containing protein n=1 Tax=Algicella marina TaxID=2683284 RepID=A0A6P1T0M5_9RHOB|nr:CAP domain-containing protein [Algicella marina]QHQ36464.1 CAP domain-containing protein [Algicella marina]
MLFRVFLLLSSILLVTACTPVGTSSSGVDFISSAETSAVRARHVDTVNALRAERGLAPVQLSARLTAAALTHARDMSVQERAWHFGSDGTSPNDRAARAGFQGQVFGENISESFDDEVSLFQSWLDDPTTRRVMLAPQATSIGFGWFQESNGKLWWVQVIGGPS